MRKAMAEEEKRDMGEAFGASLKLRALTPEDSRTVARLEQEIFGTPWSEQTVEESIRKAASGIRKEEEGRSSAAYGAFGICLGEELCGYLFSMAVAGEGELHRIAVRKEYRRLGLAGKLMEQFLEWLSRENCDSAFLEVRAGNEAAVSLYRKAGFSEIGRRRAYYKNPTEDALILKYH